MHDHTQAHHTEATSSATSTPNVADRSAPQLPGAVPAARFGRHEGKSLASLSDADLQRYASYVSEKVDHPPLLHFQKQNLRALAEAQDEQLQRLTGVSKRSTPHS